MSLSHFNCRKKYGNTSTCLRILPLKLEQQNHKIRFNTKKNEKTILVPVNNGNGIIQAAGLQNCRYWNQSIWWVRMLKKLSSPISYKSLSYYTIHQLITYWQLALHMQANVKTACKEDTIWQVCYGSRSLFQMLNFSNWNIQRLQYTDMYLHAKENGTKDFLL